MANVNVNVNASTEASYVRTLKWDYDGLHYTCRGVPESIKKRLVQIFNKWGIGYHGDKIECKGTSINMHVYEKQFKRVQFSLEKPAEAKNESI